jgi:hypothetical protein
MEKAMQEGNKRSKEMRAMGLDPARSKDYDEYIKIKEKSVIKILINILTI